MLSRQARLRDYLGLERNIIASSFAVFLLDMGEELWKKFLPKYLEALGAGAFGVGLFGTARDLFDAVYQYPGGWIADRLSRRSAFLISLPLRASVICFIYSTLPACFSRTRIFDGRDEHGITRHLCRDRRFAPKRTARDWFHHPINVETGSDSDRTYHWRAAYSGDGCYRRCALRAFNYLVTGGRYCFYSAGGQYSGEGL
jgi:hypothetical protein